MVNNQVDVDTRAIPINTDSDTAFTFAADLAVYETTNIVPVSDGTGIPAEERVYDFLAQTHGALGPTNVRVHHRSVIVGKNNPPTSPLVITSFFTFFSNEPHTRITALPREQKNGNITYDVFVDFAGGSFNAQGQLTIVTLEVPPGEFAAPLPVTDSAPLATDIVFRGTKGSNRVYDYFMLSLDP